MPISMGKNSTPTPNGIYTIGDRYQQLIMDSSTYGVPSNSPEGYRLEVDWATQMSYSGIYVHSAPWSVGSQGSDNVSHGCLNVSPENAAVVLQQHQARRRGRGARHRRFGAVRRRGSRRLEHPVEPWKAGNATANR